MSICDAERDTRGNTMTFKDDIPVANMLYTLELDNRLRAVGSPVPAYAMHPGFPVTPIAVPQHDGCNCSPTGTHRFRPGRLADPPQNGSTSQLL